MLKLLLDEVISPDVASSLRRSRAIIVSTMAEWEGGNFLGQGDAACLREAAAQGLTLVTYDRRTIPLLLKAWAEEERSHGGVIFMDEKSISQAEIDGLVSSLTRLTNEARKWDWTNRVSLLRH